MDQGTGGPWLLDELALVNNGGAPPPAPVPSEPQLGLCGAHFHSWEGKEVDYLYITVDNS